MKKDKLLGEGNNGSVFEFEDDQAIKVQSFHSFMRFQKCFQESSFHLLFQQDVPLITLRNIITEMESVNGEVHYTLHMQMDRARKDVW